MIMKFVVEISFISWYSNSILFNLVFPIDNTLSCFFFFLDYCLVFFIFLIIDLIIDLIFFFLIFIVTAELAIPTGMPTKNAKAENETHPVTLEAKISKCPI